MFRYFFPYQDVCLDNVLNNLKLNESFKSAIICQYERNQICVGFSKKLSNEQIKELTAFMADNPHFPQTTNATVIEQHIQKPENIFKTFGHSFLTYRFKSMDEAKDYDIVEYHFDNLSEEQREVLKEHLSNLFKFL